MKQSLIGSDKKPYDISFFTVAATKEIYYQVHDGSQRYYGQLVMQPPYNPLDHMEKVYREIQLDAPNTIRILSGKVLKK